MKPALLFSVLAVIAIMVLVSFETGPGEWMGMAPAAHRFRETTDLGGVLYVCPAADSVWGSISETLHQLRTQILMLFSAALLFLIAAFGWALYQDLIKDKFIYNDWRFTIGFAKGLFYLAIAVTIAMYSPNFFKTVGIRGVDDEQGAPRKFVLCERDTPGSRPVRESAVVLRSKLSS